MPGLLGLTSCLCSLFGLMTGLTSCLSPLFGLSFTLCLTSSLSVFATLVSSSSRLTFKLVPMLKLGDETSILLLYPRILPPILNVTCKHIQQQHSLLCSLHIVKSFETFVCLLEY